LEIARSARRGPVRDDCGTMSDAESPNGREDASVPEGGILAALPRARPQRASPRRAAARNAKSAPSRTAAQTDRPVKAAKPKAANPPGVRSTKKTAAATKSGAAGNSDAGSKPAAAKRRGAKRVAKPPEPPAPKQGYEPEEELELGGTVNPPSGAELVESVADIVGELANSGLAAGGRLLKDAFSLLRRP
jgi:hypothetical protein